MKTNNTKIIFLCSGNGGNLIFIHKAIELKWLYGEITCVITDRPCLSNNFAVDANINNHIIDFYKDGQEKLLKYLNYYNPDIIITNIHKIISTDIVTKYNKKLINLHYSLLPSFGGVIGDRPVKQAAAYGVKISGVTAHYVNENLDEGLPLAQIAIPLKRNEPDFNLLMSVFFRCGCIALLDGISQALKSENTEERVSIFSLENYTCLSSGSLNPQKYLNSNIWSYVIDKIDYLKSKKHESQ